jgi:HEAT repeat protein
LDKLAVKKLLIIGGALALVLLIVAVFVFRRPPDAVIYNGKSLKNWALQINASDQDSRNQAVAEFRTLGSNAVPGLISLLRTRDSFLRKEIWTVASKTPAPIKNAITTHVRPPDAARIRSAAACSLAAIGSDAVSAVPSLARMLLKDEAQGRMEAALALGSIGGRGITELIAALGAKNTNIRYASVCGLGKVWPPDNQLVLALLKASGDTNAGIAVPAGGALSRLGTNALPFVTIALDSPEMETRRQATRALGTLRAPRDDIVPLLLRMLKDKEPACRLQAAQTLGLSGLPNPTMLAGLTGALDDSDRDVRVAAIQGLRQGHQMAARTVPDLVRCLDDSSPLVRQSAAEALGVFGPKARIALPRLTLAVNDKDVKVSAAAAAAVAKIEPLAGSN